MSTSLTKRLKQQNFSLSDLDGLLVNAENFNQLFVQRIDPEWIAKTIQRIIKSDSHLKRLTQILISFITSERHPDWVHHALVWLTHLLESPACDRIQTDPGLLEIFRPLISYTNEIAGLKDLVSHCAIRCNAIVQWAKASESKTGVPHNLYYGGLLDVPSTGYVYLDDSDEEFGQRSSRVRSKKRGHLPPTSDIECIDNIEDLDELDLDSAEDDFEDEDAADPFDQSDTEAVMDSDHGVFDVNETASSDDPPNQELISPNSAISPASSHVEDVEDRDDDVGIDEGDSSSDLEQEALDLLMWSRDHVSSSSSSEASADEIPAPKMNATPKPTKRRGGFQTGSQRSATRQQAAQHTKRRRTSEPTDSRRKK